MSESVRIEPGDVRYSAIVSAWHRAGTPGTIAWAGRQWSVITDGWEDSEDGTAYIFVDAGPSQAGEERISSFE